MMGQLVTSSLLSLRPRTILPISESNTLQHSSLIFFTQIALKWRENFLNINIYNENKMYKNQYNVS
jgi:hypothetical protein